MNMNKLIRALLGMVSFTALIVVGCSSPSTDQPANNENEAVSTDEVDAIFPRGDKGPEEYFTGTAYNYGLVSMDSVYTMVMGNVYFEPGARRNWHTHPAGQILVITDGVGYHQIEGQPRQTIRRGDVIQCPPNAKHWHGASADTGMQQMYILPNTENGVVEWMEPVTDEEYHGSSAAGN